MDRKELKERSKELEPILRVGKNGLGEGQINEIKRTLQLKKLIKVKILKSFFEGKDKQALAQELAEKTNSVLIDNVGNIVVLYKGVVK